MRLLESGADLNSLDIKTVLAEAAEMERETVELEAHLREEMAEREEAVVRLLLQYGATWE
jgi:hypothetical protein